MTRIIITGSKGRMGRALVSCARFFPDLKLAAEIDQGDSLQASIDGCDAVIDFSYHSATVDFTRQCAAKGKAIVIGTTGLSDTDRKEIASLATKIPIVLSSNYATGVNALFWLTRKAAEILGPGFDLEVVEMHHRMKKDAPSGTAKTLAEILAEVRKKQLEEVVRHGRSGLVGERTSEEIGMHAIRGGDVVGDHTVIFASTGERVELTHKATSRDTLANGALRAALWVAGQKPGLYDMQDVLGLK